MSHASEYNSQPRLPRSIITPVAEVGSAGFTIPWCATLHCPHLSQGDSDLCADCQVLAARYDRLEAGALTSWPPTPGAPTPAPPPASPNPAAGPSPAVPRPDSRFSLLPGRLDGGVQVLRDPRWIDPMLMAVAFALFAGGVAAEAVRTGAVRCLKAIRHSQMARQAAAEEVGPR